jgi:hypothetical protein
LHHFRATPRFFVFFRTFSGKNKWQNTRYGLPEDPILGNYISKCAFFAFL